MSTAKRKRQKEGKRMRQSALEDARKRSATRKRFTILSIIMAIVIAFLLINRDDSSSKSSSSTTALAAFPTKSTNCPADINNLPKTTTFTEPQPFCLDKGKSYTATMSTDAGDIVIALDPDKAPNTVNNFVMLSRYQFYNGLTFHRVIKDFVLQGGDPEGTGAGGPGYQFDDELSSPDDYKAGSLAMANSGPDTNGSQFFIVTTDNGAKSLVEAAGGKAAYSLFGQVTQGMDVVAKIEADGGTDGQGTPVVKHTIKSVTITES